MDITTLILMFIPVNLTNLRGMGEKFKPHHAPNALEVDLSDYCKQPFTEQLLPNFGFYL